MVVIVVLAGCQTATVPDRAARNNQHDDFSDARTRSSWNPHVGCRATVTRLGKVLGSRRSNLGGATFAGGRFRPGIPNKRALHPPCRVRGVRTLVQLNRVRVGSCHRINDDGDWSCTLFDPHAHNRSANLRRIHIETDRKFRHRRGWSVPPGGTSINVQGFVYWDPGHVRESWHNRSGWELHSFTAWRRAR